VSLIVKSTGGLLAVLLVAGGAATYKSTVAYQTGNAGLAMELVQSKEQVERRVAANEVPPALPPATQDGKLAVDAYKNVLVLGHLSSGDFTRLMTAMTLWVAPNEGCAYCHAHQKDKGGNDIKNGDGYAVADAENMQSDERYAKRVARRMLQMTMRINGDWTQHVKATGVTCYTCHRGNPVPTYIWYDVPDQVTGSGMMGNKAHQNAPAEVVGLSSLPNNAFQTFLTSDESIRVQSTTAIDSADRSSIKQTEWTYGLMMHMSSALGVNCTYCHNTRSMGEWTTSPSTRAQAWYGIRMVRELNSQYLEPLTSTFPEERLGPTGDGPKLNCATCHQGAFKPLLGVSMLADYPVLAHAVIQPSKTPEPVVPAPDSAITGDAGVPLAPDAAPGDAGVRAAEAGVIPAASGAPSGSAPLSAPSPSASARPGNRHP
jgi:photosynthetic reaction center cytochrome c subunit